MMNWTGSQNDSTARPMPWRLTPTESGTGSPASVAATTSDVADVPTPPAAMAPSDPRWVFAMRASESLEGAVLRPERRDRLDRLARLLGLNPFEASLIIAMIQDQARRGIPAGQRLRAVHGDLLMMSRSRPRSSERFGHITLAVAVLMLVEVLALLWLL